MVVQEEDLGVFKQEEDLGVFKKDKKEMGVRNFFPVKATLCFLFGTLFRNESLNRNLG